tara:strand:- start:189 stop:674 length:486 start_codon:yes stop_codon:yes gene_type:complete
MRLNSFTILSIFATQLLCAGFFIFDLSITLLGLRSTSKSWEFMEFLEIIASLGLVLGAFLGARAVIVARRHQQLAQNALRSVSGAFNVVVNEKFDNWGLTSSEKDVAWFVIKGFSNSEISEFRGSSEGTIKAQLNAVYRKSGSISRSQMISIIVEDLLLQD